MNTYEIMFLSASLTVNIFLSAELIRHRLGANSIIVTKDAEPYEEVNSIISSTFGRKQIIAIANINEKTVTTVRRGYTAEFIRDTSGDHTSL